jgi:Zn-dependent M28 family amino/carboxypeptidase
MEVHKKLTWGVGRDQSTKKLLVKPGVLNNGDKIDIKVEAVFKKNYKARNVVGMIRGSQHADSFIVVTGHYDHLGKMGQNCYIPGANDNASGIAMILDLMHYYRQHPPKFSVIFIGFAGEEAGLVGSYYFVKEMENYLDKNAIRFVVNMDLMGSGQEGIMAVNGAVYNEEYALLKSINDQKKFLPQTKKRGKAANSDHYFFGEVGVPAFFFYLMGPYSHYHDVDDTAENLRLEKQYYDGSFNLVRHFMDALMSG